MAPVHRMGDASRPMESQGNVGENRALLDGVVGVQEHAGDDGAGGPDEGVAMPGQGLLEARLELAAVADAAVHIGVAQLGDGLLAAHDVDLRHGAHHPRAAPGLALQVRRGERGGVDAPLLVEAEAAAAEALRAQVLGRHRLPHVGGHAQLEDGRVEGAVGGGDGAALRGRAVDEERRVLGYQDGEVEGRQLQQRLVEHGQPGRGGGLPPVVQLEFDLVGPGLQHHEAAERPLRHGPVLLPEGLVQRVSGFDGYEVLHCAWCGDGRIVMARAYY